MRFRVGRTAALQVTVAMLLALPGCMGMRGHYVVQDTPIVMPADLERPDEESLVALSFEFQSNGGTNLSGTRIYRPTVERVLGRSGFFSEVVDSDSVAEGHLDFVIDNRYGGLGGAVAQGFFSGLTLGFIGTRVTDRYEIELAYQRSEGGGQLDRSYQRDMVSTSGLITRGVPGAENHPDTNAALDTLLEQVLLQFLAELGESGVLEAAEP